MEPTETSENLMMMIRNLKPWLEPAGPQTFAVQLARLMEFARAFNAEIPSPDKAAKIYRETLGTLPADLLDLAISRTKETWRWGNRLPLPADIRATVREDFARRRLEMSKLRAMMGKAKSSHPIPTLAERIDARLTR